ncbi:MAG: hypothetical protein L6V95_09775 [Candidatus Melainabacteria bacterium]|nr:MAG: hypothetical protein L6V95_09775 [Candidatus Melainabacteria bacterium]
MSVYNSENKVIKSCGELTHFEFSFKIFKEEDLTVSLINPTTQALTNLKLNEDYTVSISRVNDGGSIELMEKHNGYNIYIYREIEIIQPHEIPTEGYFPELTIENALDRSCMIDQQLHEVVNRCVKLPGFSDITEIEIEPPINGKTLVWGVNNGKATIKNSNYSPDSIAETVENAAKQALQKANEAQEAATTATEQAAIAVESAQSAVNRVTTSLDNLTDSGKAKFDSKWASNTTQIFSNANLSSSTYSEYTLDFLPDNGEYELMCNYNITPGVSNGYVRLYLADESETFVWLNGLNSNTNYNTQLQGSSIVVIKNKKIKAKKAAGGNGNERFSLTVIAYRKLGVGFATTNESEVTQDE